MAEALTDQEKKIVALALHGLTMRNAEARDDPIFATATEICRKLDAAELLAAYSRDWIQSASIRSGSE